MSRSILRILGIVVGVLALLGLVFIFGVWWGLGAHSGVTVRVRNALAEPVSNVSLRLNRQGAWIDRVEPGEIEQAIVHPWGESSLVIAYEAQPGRQPSTDLDLYFETGYAGTVNVVIEASGVHLDGHPDICILPLFGCPGR